MTLLDKLLARVARVGDLTVKLPGGREVRSGQ